MSNRKIIQNLERLRADILAGASTDCYACAQKGPSVDCDVCGGAGLIVPEDGIYNPGLAGSLLGAVCDLVVALAPQHGLDPDLRALLVWVRDYREDMAVHHMVKSSPENFAAMRERADGLYGDKSESLAGIQRALNDTEGMTPEQIRAYVRNLRDGDGSETVDA